jgi:hypothetical protein
VAKTLTVEQISNMEEQFGQLVRTAKSGVNLASLCRGAIRGCDKDNDPTGHIEAMLSRFLELSGFSLPPRAQDCLEKV